MIVCSCRRVRDAEIRELIAQSQQPLRLRDLRRCLGVCGECGRCGPTAQKLLRSLNPLARLETVSVGPAPTERCPLDELGPAVSANETLGDGPSTRVAVDRHAPPQRAARIGAMTSLPRHRSHATRSTRNVGVHRPTDGLRATAGDVAPSDPPVVIDRRPPTRPPAATVLGATS